MYKYDVVTLMHTQARAFVPHDRDAGFARACSSRSLVNFYKDTWDSAWTVMVFKQRHERISALLDEVVTSCSRLRALAQHTRADPGT
jgi:hypothetical protein